MALEKREERVKRRKDPKAPRAVRLEAELCQSLQETKGSSEIPSHNIDKHRLICIINPLSEKMGS